MKSKKIIIYANIANEISKLSKDPNTKVGTVIVHPHHGIISTGYNGMPRTKDALDNDIIYPWHGEHKYDYVVHSEINAILNCPVPVKGCTLFVTHFPCFNCAKAIIQSGITQVFFVNMFTKSYFQKDINAKITTVLQAKQIKQMLCNSNITIKKINVYKQM